MISESIARRIHWQRRDEELSVDCYLVIFGYGLCFRRAKDGFWSCNGRRCPLREVTPLFVNYTVKGYQIKIARKRLASKDDVVVKDSI